MNDRPIKPPRRPFTNALTYLLPLLLALIPGVAHAMEDIDPLALLVETLASSDDLSVQEALLEGMLSGLEGRRNVASPNGWIR